MDHVPPCSEVAGGRARAAARHENMALSPRCRKRTLEMSEPALPRDPRGTADASRSTAEATIRPVLQICHEDAESPHLCTQGRLLCGWSFGERREPTVNCGRESFRIRVPFHGVGTGRERLESHEI